MELLWQPLSHYFQQLDWTFIITFIVLVYGLHRSPLLKWLGNAIGFELPKRYRVLLVGILYGSFIFWLRDGGKTTLESLVQSLVFAMVFHKLLLDFLLRKLTSKSNTDQIF